MHVDTKVHKKPLKTKKFITANRKVPMSTTKNSDFLAHSKIRMFSPEAKRNPNNTVHRNERNIGFHSNPHTAGNGQRYMNKRRNQSKDNHATRENKYLPSVENSERVKSPTENSMGTRYIHNLKKVKIRTQGKPGEEIMGYLESAIGTRKIKKLTNFSLKDAERHTSLLSKIEKYKEDKILQELEQIEVEKVKTAKLLKLTRMKEEKRKAYLGTIILINQPNL
jgi:hypothetical protein